MRKIVHIDMDAFYASVEQRDDPKLRGKPVVVAWKGRRSVVCAASYEARKFGVRSAMPALRAERLCPQAIFVPPNFAAYRAVSKQVHEIFQRYTDHIEPLSLDEAYLDVTENKLGLSSAREVAEAIRVDIKNETQLTASAGVAANKFIAKIASDWRKPDGLFVVPPQRALNFLTSLPISKIPGVGKVTEQQFLRLGLSTVGELRDLSQQSLEEKFGRWGLRLYQLARGIDDSPVSNERSTHSISSEDTFAEDRMLDELDPAIIELAKKTWSAAHKEPRVGRTVVLKLKTSEFQTITRSLTPSAPPASAEELIEIALALRERVDLPARSRYRLVGVGLAQFVEPDDPILQSGLFER